MTNFGIENKAKVFIFGYLLWSFVALYCSDVWDLIKMSSKYGAIVL